jgi:excisionase family DNA binding protein
MYLGTQAAAHRLGVSPHTLLRWSASGILPCVRTAGGHRRFREEDGKELAGEGNPLRPPSAKRARERELETLVDMTVRLCSRLDLSEALVEVAHQGTGLLRCQACMIYEFDRESGTLRCLAEFDSSGNRLPDRPIYSIREFPLTSRVLLKEETAIVNIDDPAADAAEIAAMRPWDIKCILMAPLTSGGGSIGLLELIDRERERRFSRQELRMVRTLAAAASVAIQNAEALAAVRRGGLEAERFGAAIERMVAALGAVCNASTSSEVLRATAATACEALDYTVATATWTDDCSSAVNTASGLDMPHGRPEQQHVHAIVCRAPCGDGHLVLSGSVCETPPATLGGLARLLVSVAGLTITRLSAAEHSSTSGEAASVTPVRPSFTLSRE